MPPHLKTGMANPEMGVAFSVKWDAFSPTCGKMGGGKCCKMMQIRQMDVTKWLREMGGGEEMPRHLRQNRDGKMGWHFASNAINA